MGGASGPPRTCKGLFTRITQALNIDDTGPAERKVTQAAIPGPVVDLRALPECAQYIATGSSTGEMHLADLMTLAGGTHYARPGNPVEARQEEVSNLNVRVCEVGGQQQTTTPRWV